MKTSQLKQLMRGTGLPAALATLVFHEREQNKVLAGIWLFASILLPALLILAYYWVNSPNLVVKDKRLGGILFAEFWPIAIATLFSILLISFLFAYLLREAKRIFDEYYPRMNSKLKNFPFEIYANDLEPEKSEFVSPLQAAIETHSLAGPMPFFGFQTSVNISFCRTVCLIGGETRKIVFESLGSVESFWEYPICLMVISIWIAGWIGDFRFTYIVIYASFIVLAVLIFRKTMATAVASRIAIVRIAETLLETAIRRAAAGEADSA